MGRYIAPRITSCNVMVYGSAILVGSMLVENLRWVLSCVYPVHVKTIDKQFAFYEEKMVKRVFPAC